MAGSADYGPGSRAIKIPLNGAGMNDCPVPGRPRRTTQSRTTARLERTDSSDAATYSSDPWSTSSPASSSTSASFSRPREVTGGLLHTQKSVISPSNIMSHTRNNLSGGSDGITNHHNSGISKRSKDKQRTGVNRHSIGNVSPPNTVPSRPIHQNRTDSFASYNSPLGPSMLSSSSYKSINLTSPHQSSDEPARLITYTKHSQGFTWNDELFLPSYLMGRRYGGGRRRWGGYDADEDMDDVGDFDEEGDHCPVTDIFVTDEEAAAMMP